jgi:hypothetical protein
VTSSPSGIDCGDTCTQNRQGARPDHSTIDPRPAPTRSSSETPDQHRTGAVGFGRRRPGRQGDEFTLGHRLRRYLQCCLYAGNASLRDRGGRLGLRGLGGACSGVAPSCAATISASTSASAIYHPFCCPSGFPARCRGAAARGAVAAFRGADRILRPSGQRRRTARAGQRAGSKSRVEGDPVHCGSTARSCALRC